MAKDKDLKTPNVPPLRFPGFTDEWKKITLGEIADVTKLAGYEFTKYVIYEDEGEIIALRGLNCKSGQLVLDDVKYIDHSDLSKLTRSKLYIGDILFTYVGTVGEVAIIDKNDKYYLAPNVSRIRLRPGNCEGFVMQQLSSKKFYNSIVFPLIATSSQPALSMENVRKFVISIPSIKEQNKIAQLLSIIDERIATQNKIIDNLQSLIKGLAKTHYDSCETLSNVRIRELGEPYSVMNLSKEQLSDNGQPCILYGELFTQYGPVIESIYSKTNVESNLSLSNGRDLLFPSSTTVDALSLIAPSALTKPNIILGGDMFGIKVANEYSPEYLSYYFNYIGNHELAKYAIGSTIIHLHYKDIAEHTIAVPTLRNQLSFVKLASTMKSKIENERSVLHNLKTLKAYLLQAMFI